MRLSEEERNLLTLFALRLVEWSLSRSSRTVTHGGMMDRLDAFVAEFDSDPTKWRAEIAPARPLMTDDREG